MKRWLPEVFKVCPKWVVNFQPTKLNNAKNQEKMKTLPQK
jgi:hypothetical protein